MQFVREQLIVPQDSISLNNWESNNQRYRESLNSEQYNAVVVDLDGVIIKGNELDKEAFISLCSKTVLNPNGRVPVAFVSGRTLPEIEEMVLKELRAIVPINNPLKQNEVTVFANNAAIGVDIATDDILYEVPIDELAIEEALKLPIFQNLINISALQANLVKPDGSREVPRAKTIRDKYTFTLGLNLDKLKLISCLENGGNQIEVFRSTFGDVTNLIYISQVLNYLFESEDLPLVVSTSGGLLDINLKGVSKATSIQVIRQILAKIGECPIGNVDPSRILSIGDSVLGNDESITQRKGGFTNSTTILSGNLYPISISEEGDQYRKVSSFMSKANIVPANYQAMTLRHFDDDYITSDDSSLEEFLGDTDDLLNFDITGALRITSNVFESLLKNERVSKDLVRFLETHATLINGEEGSYIYLRSARYYDNIINANTTTLVAELIHIESLVKEFNIEEKENLDLSERLILMVLLDHAKGYLLRILNSELNNGIEKDNASNIEALIEVTQSYIDNYYRCLLKQPLKKLASIPNIELHEVEINRDLPFLDRIREMDNPIYIIKHVNNVAKKMQRYGVNYDYVVTPFYGAGELGFALRTIMDVRNMIDIPRVIPVRLDGRRARVHLKQGLIFYQGMKAFFTGKKILILDDNSGTGNSLRAIESEVLTYAPKSVDKSVVQVAIATRIHWVLDGIRRNFHRRIIEPEDLTYKALMIQNMRKSSARAETYFLYPSVYDTINAR